MDRADFMVPVEYGATHWLEAITHASHGISPPDRVRVRPACEDAAHVGRSRHDVAQYERLVSPDGIRWATG
jgi:hypothetical protein